MNKIILLIIGLCFPQFYSGTLSTGALVDYFENPSSDYSRLDIEPELSYFIANNLSFDFLTQLIWVTNGNFSDEYQKIGAALTSYSYNGLYAGAGFLLEDEDTDIALHFGSLSSLSDNIYLDIRFWLETKDGSGFDGIYDENYYYGFDIGIKGFFIPN